MKIKIEKIGINGEGIGYYRRIPIFCDGALPEEIINVKLPTTEAKYYRVKEYTIISPSPLRVKPICPYQKECGGCGLMHMNLEAQKKWKRELLVEALWKYGHVKDHFIRDMKDAKNSLHYRNACKLPVQEVNGKIVTGMFQPNSNHFIPIETCMIHTKELEDLRKQLLHILNKHSFPAFNPKSKNGLRYLVLRTLSNESQCTLVTGKDTISKELIDDLMNIPTLVSLSQSIQTDKHAHEIFGKKIQLLAGKETISFMINGISLELSADSFFQLNTEQASKLYDMAVQKIDTCDTLVEAYCGIGAMSILASSKAKHIIGIEYVPNAIENAKRNALKNETQIEFIVGDAAKQLKKICKERKVDALLVDPPRSGLDDAFIETVLENEIKRIVYVSCNPATLGKNLKLLKQKYQVRTVIPFDLFPNTPQVESITVLERG